MVVDELWCSNCRSVLCTMQCLLLCLNSALKSLVVHVDNRAAQEDELVVVDAIYGEDIVLRGPCACEVWHLRVIGVLESLPAVTQQPLCAFTGSYPQ